jgi:REP element-mobilizing transposase RayT
MAKLSHFYLENQVYFITTATEGRKPVFAKEEDALIL